MRTTMTAAFLIFIVCRPCAAADTKTAPKKPATIKPAVVRPNDESPATKPVAPKPTTPGGKYVAHDMKRPRPVVITPPTESGPSGVGTPPSDAIVLFDGRDFDRWTIEKRDPVTKKMITAVPTWKLADGYMEIAPRSGGTIVTRDEFGDCQLHIEWATPTEVKGNGQGRGNSGVMIHGFCEVQVLDSFGNDTYPDGQAAAIYGSYPPLVNASRKPGVWQTYDIILESARIDQATKKVTRPARITVLHNGVVVHHAVELGSRQSKFKLALQDHGNTVRYRNIWLRPLKGYDAQ